MGNAIHSYFGGRKPMEPTPWSPWSILIRQSVPNPYCGSDEVIMYVFGPSPHAHSLIYQPGILPHISPRVAPLPCTLCAENDGTYNAGNIALQAGKSFDLVALVALLSRYATHPELSAQPFFAVVTAVLEHSWNGTSYLYGTYNAGNIALQAGKSFDLVALAALLSRYATHPELSAKPFFAVITAVLERSWNDTSYL